MSRRTRRIGFGILAAGLALALALAASEFALRKLSPTYRRLHSPPFPFFVPHDSRGWALRPGYQSREVWGFEFRVNRLGFRGPELEEKKPDGVYRVLVLGDSVVMGAALPEEALAASKLAELLSAAHPGRKIEAINGGVGGYDIKEERQLLLEDGLQLSPDAVVLVFCVNDVPGVGIGEQVNPLRDVWAPGKAWLVKESALALFIQSLYEQIGLKREGRLSDRLAADRSPSTQARIDQGWREYESELGQMVKAGEAQGAGFVLVAVPHAAQFIDQRKRFLPQKRLAAMARRLNIAFIDLAPDFAAQASLPYVFPDPVHPNANGQKIMAERIAQVLNPLVP